MPGHMTMHMTAPEFGCIFLHIIRRAAEVQHHSKWRTSPVAAQMCALCVAGLHVQCGRQVSTQPLNGQRRSVTAQPLCCSAVQVRAEGRRGKVPLEKGFSQVAWVKLTKSGADLTGGKPQHTSYSAVNNGAVGRFDAGVATSQTV